jgi:hypothetical protein
VRARVIEGQYRRLDAFTDARVVGDLQQIVLEAAA